MNVFELFGTIAIDNQGANKAITDTTRHAGKMHGAMQQSFEKIGVAAVACGNLIAKGVTAGAKAIANLTKSTIGGYANYEQLVGGIETLFKESQDRVMAYAQNAYKTAGLSSNQYMETATSFSASLIKGLAGDTEKAAEYTQIAITDMSDNANKMGTDMGLIQNAYQGFAKQNYTMLDNLKIGYGGTQEEMARLVNESGVLGAAIKVDAKTINEVSFDKIIQAIHIIQERMGITGTTAKEASETISGSVASFRATWANLLTGLSSDDQNLDELWENFTLAGETVVRNVGRILPNLLRNIKNILGKATQYAGQMIQKGWTETIWPFIQKQMKVRFGIELPDWETLKRTISVKWKEVMTAFHEGGLFKAFRVLLPDWNTLTAGISDGWEKIVWPIVQGIFKTVFKVELPDWETLKRNIEDGWNNVVWAKVQSLFSAAFHVQLPDWSTTLTELSTWWEKSFGPVSENIKSFATDVGNALNAIKDWATGDGKELAGAVLGIAVAFAAVSGAVGMLSNPLLWVLGIAALIVANWESVKAAVDAAFTATVDWLTTNLGQPLEDFRKNVIEPIANAWTETVAPAIRNAISAVGDFLGLDLLEGWDTLTNSIKEAWQGIINKISAAASAVENFLGLEGGKGLGGGDTRPWYVREHPERYGAADGSHASGLTRVPFDGYRAILHRNEAVLTSTQADVWRKEAAGGGTTGKLEALMSQMLGLLQRMAESAGAGQSIVLDSGVLVGQLAPALNARLGTISERNKRGNS